MDNLLEKILEDPLKYYNLEQLNTLNKKIYSIIQNKKRNEREYVFTDGCAINNGKSNSRGGYGIYFGKKDPRNRSIKVDGNITNNQMELVAIYECLKLLDNKKYIIVSDSEYSIKCITIWYKKWIKNDWKTSNGSPVKNKKIIIEILKLLKDKDVLFQHIRSHMSEPEDKNSFQYKLWYGNHVADKLAQNEN
jgi:ribonuclease HI